MRIFRESEYIEQELENLERVRRSEPLSTIHTDIHLEQKLSLLSLLNTQTVRHCFDY